MEMILRADELFRALMPLVALGVAGFILLLVLFRFVCGSRVHRLTIALCAVLLGVFGLYYAVGTFVVLFSGYSAFAAFLGCIAGAFCAFSVLFVRIARSI